MKHYLDWAVGRSPREKQQRTDPTKCIETIEAGMDLRIPMHARIPYKPARPKDAPESVQHQSPQHTSADTADAHDDSTTRTQTTKPAANAGKRWGRRSASTAAAGGEGQPSWGQWKQTQHHHQPRELRRQHHPTLPRSVSGTAACNTF